MNQLRFTLKNLASVKFGWKALFARGAPNHTPQVIAIRADTPRGRFVRRVDAMEECQRRSSHEPLTFAKLRKSPRKQRAEGGGAAWPLREPINDSFVGWRGFRRLRFLLGLGGEQGQLVGREAVAVTLLAVLFPRLLRGRRAHMNLVAWLELFAGPFQHAFLPRENRVLHPVRSVLPFAVLLVGGVRRHRNEKVLADFLDLADTADLVHFAKLGHLSLLSLRRRPVAMAIDQRRQRRPWSRKAMGRSGQAQR